MRVIEHRIRGLRVVGGHARAVDGGNCGEFAEQDPRFDRLWQVLIHPCREVFLPGASHRVCRDRNDSDAVGRRREGADALRRLLSV